MKTHNNPATAVVAFLAVITVSQGIAAQEARSPNRSAQVEARFDVGGGQTDNLGRDASLIRSDFDFIGLNLDAGMDRMRLDGRIFSNLNLRKYETQGVAEDEDDVVGSLDGELLVRVVPERFIWEFAQNFGQMRTDPLLPSSLNNREATSVFSMGPRIDLPVGARNIVQIVSRLSERSFDDSTHLNGRLTENQVALIHAINRATRLRVGVDNSKNVLDSGSEPYRFGNTYVTYERDFASGGVELTFGRGEIDLPSTDAESTTIMRFGWNRNVGVRAHLNAWAGREVTDAGEIFRLAGSPDLGAGSRSSITQIIYANDHRLQGIVVSENPLTRATAGISLDWDGSRTSAGLSLSTSEDDFELDETLDNDLAMIDIYFQRSFARRWTLEVGLSTQRQQFAVGGQTDKDALRRVALRRTLGRSLLVSFVGEHNSRQGPLDPYDEDLYTISIGYSLSR